MADSAVGSEEAVRTEARALLSSLDSLRLDRYAIVGNYVRFNETTRSSLKELRQRIVGYLHGQAVQPSNFLVWGAPGSGKSYLIQQIAKAAGAGVEYRELNLAKLDEHSLVSRLDELAPIDRPVICLIDEADAKPTEAWPYEVLLPYLEPSVPRKFATCYCLAGSGGANLEEMKSRIRARPKGPDLLSRIARGNEFVVESLGIGDKLLVSIAQLIQSSQEEGREIHEIEKLALFYIATHPGFASARQLRNLAAESARRVPVGEDRIRYDYLFGAGDPENKEFWTTTGPLRQNLANSFIHIEIGTVGGPPSRPLSPSAPKAETPAVAPVPPTDARRIVVLPFTNISPDPQDEYFADGMTEELIEKLAHVSGLKVIARTTAMHYKNRSETALEIGRALNVGSVAECSVRKAGAKIRITAQLIDTTTEEHLWAGRYDRQLDDIFAIQEEIASHIAKAISDQLSARAGPNVVAFSRTAPDTEDMVAYTDFLQGRQLLSARVSEESIRKSLEFFERAVARDPKFARARVSIAEAILWLASEGVVSESEARKRAQDELKEAFRLNEGLGEAHSVYASILLAAEDFEGSQKESYRAIALNPNLADPYRWLGQIAAGAGKIDECLRLLETARQVDPLDVNVLAFLGRALFYAGREEEALAHWERYKPLIAFRTNQHLTEYYVSKGDTVRARETLREMERIRPTNAWAEMYRGYIAAMEGDLETAQKTVQSLLGREHGKEMRIFLAGFVQYAMGDLDAFFQSMERCRREGSEPVLELKYSPLFRAARADPRFLKFSESWDKHMIWHPQPLGGAA